MAGQEDERGTEAGEPGAAAVATKGYMPNSCSDPSTNSSESHEAHSLAQTGF